jgi:DNA-directed RNA polymerase specialized sigma24 family protein
MARLGHNDPVRWDSEAVPPFWLPNDERIDQRVRSVAEQNWSWAFWLLKRQLNDGARTPETVEDVAVEVSSRLRADANVGKNLNGYFRTALIRRVKTHVARESRITYEGGPQDLEANHHPQASDWTKVFEDRLALRSLLPYMSYPVSQILYYRMLDFRWKQIGKVLGMTEKQAKSRFYYGVRQAHDELLATQAKRARQKETDPWR